MPHEWDAISPISGVDPEVPVLHLRDTSKVHRDAFVLLADEDRQVLSWVLDRSRTARDRQHGAPFRRAVFDSWWARVGALFVVAAQAAELVITALRGTH